MIDKAKLKAVIDGLPKEGAVGAAADFTLPAWLLPIIKMVLQAILTALGG